MNSEETSGKRMFMKYDTDTPTDVAEQLLCPYTHQAPLLSPKGLCTLAGYLTQVVFTHKYVLDLKPDTDVYCAADIIGNWP